MVVFTSIVTLSIDFSFKDGHIDFLEFMTVMHVMSRGSSEENLRQIFRVFDIDRDGSISKEELRKIVSDFQLENKESEFLVSSGKMWTTQLSFFLTIYRLAFKEMDENKDGVISLEEFVEVNSEQSNYESIVLFVSGMHGSEENIQITDIEDHRSFHSRLK